MAKYIQYIGTSHVREISEKDWRTVGVQDQKTLVWSRTNAFLVPLEDVTDAAWPFIEADAELVVVDRLKREKPNQPEDADMGPENTTGYLDALRAEDAADTGEEVVVVQEATPADQQTGAVDAKATSKANKK